MNSVKSITAGGKNSAKDVMAHFLPLFAAVSPTKLWWFSKVGYKPHVWQTAFHSAVNDLGRLCRFRHLVAGRRGGKTLSAAWEVLFYCLFPSEFHNDFHGEESQRPLWVWVLAKDHEVGFAAKVAFLECIAQAGLVKDKDYVYNKTEKKIEFTNGTLVQFKTADDPQSLRGAGLDILWIDEAAFLPNDEAWGVVEPAIGDKEGAVITTTTPKGVNWYHEKFWSASAKADPDEFRVEYTSLDNPYFKKKEWERFKRNMHPILFKQEFMAAFDAMQGVELHSDWLHYYVYGAPEANSGDITLPRSKDGKIRLRKYIGIDPAISLSDKADYFAMCLVGVSESGDQAFILKTYRDRLPFPDQIDKIQEWWLEHRPEYIAIEANVFQVALAQQSSRIDGLPPIAPIISKGKKKDRIMSMAPLFRIGKVRLHAPTAVDFISEWIGYDSEIKNPQDDLLDAAEIALSAAGVLLPTTEWEEPKGPRSLEEEAAMQIKRGKASGGHTRRNLYDEELGSSA